MNTYPERRGLMCISLLLVGCTRLVHDPVPPNLKAVSTCIEVYNRENDFRKTHGHYAGLDDLSLKWDDMPPRVSEVRRRGGYYFRLRLRGDNYILTAEPVRWSVDGRESFYMDQTRIIRYSRSKTPAGPNSPIRELK